MENDYSQAAKWLGLGLIIFIAALVRFYFMKNWLGYDECQHFLIANSPYFKNFIREYKMRAHPPLTYMLMKPILQFGSHAFLVKMASYLSGLISVILSYFVLLKAVKSIWAAQLGAFCLSFIPQFVYQSVEVRQYSLCLIFIWLSLFMYFQMYEKQFEGYKDHYLLALTFFLAIITEYTAVFHIVALFIVVYLPFSLSLIKRRKWKQLSIVLLPHLITFLVGFTLFRWQFKPSGTSFALYNSEYLYGGSLTDLGKIFVFFFHHFPEFMGDIIPNPWGICLIFLLIMAFIPNILNDHLLAYKGKAFACVGFLSISFIFIASLLKQFPFGGTSRHAVVVFPGILLACFIVIVAISRKFSSGKKAQFFFVTLTIVVFGLGLIKGLNYFKRDKRTLQDLKQMVHFEEYFQEPCSIVANWRGRSLLSWWYLSKRKPQMIDRGKNRTVFIDYEGIKVVQTKMPIDVLKRAIYCAQKEEQSWIFFSNFSAKSVERYYHSLLEIIKKVPNISVSFHGMSDFIIPTTVIKIESNKK